MTAAAVALGCSRCAPPRTAPGHRRPPPGSPTASPSARRARLRRSSARRARCSARSDCGSTRRRCSSPRMLSAGSRREATFTVLDYQSGGGGWLRVQGQSMAGWIVADPTLTRRARSTSSRSQTASPRCTRRPGASSRSRSASSFVPQQGRAEHAARDRADAQVVRGRRACPAIRSPAQHRLSCAATPARLSTTRKMQRQHRRDADRAARRATTPALRRDPHQVRRDARDADRVQLPEQRAARRVRGRCTTRSRSPSRSARRPPRRRRQPAVARQSTCVPVL